MGGHRVTLTGLLYQEFVGSGMSGVTLLHFTPIMLGWHTVQENCESVQGENSLDAEIWACAMMIESMKKWVD